MPKKNVKRRDLARKSNVDTKNTTGTNIVASSPENSRLGQITNEIKPSALNRIYRQAELHGFLGYLYEIYKKIEAYDPTIKGLIERRRKAPTRYRIYHRNKYPDVSGSAEAVQQLANNYSKINQRELIRSGMDGVLRGLSLMEVPYWKHDELFYFGDPEKISESRYGQDLESFENPRWGELYLADDGFGMNKKYIKNIDSYKLIKFSYGADKGFYDLAGVLRPIVKWYVLQYYMTKFWMDHAQIHGTPVSVVKVPKSEYESVKDEIEDFLSSVGRNRYGIMFTGMEYEIHNEKSYTNSQIFRDFNHYADNKIAFGLFGQTLSTSNEGGYASSVAGQNVDLDLIIDDATNISETITNDLNKPWMRINYPNMPDDLVETYIDVPAKKNVEWLRAKYEILGKNRAKIKKSEMEEDLDTELYSKKRHGSSEEEFVVVNWDGNKNDEFGDNRDDPEKRKGDRTDGGSVSDDNKSRGNASKSE